MGVTFIREDITKMAVDAVVNAANMDLSGGGGVDGAIHTAAGPELDEYCKKLGGCEVGEAKITPGFLLPAKYIIHTVGPVWCGGTQHEKTLLISCYLRSLELALENGCQTVAFPLISAGAYGYPYQEAMQIAYDSCEMFLKRTDAAMEIFIMLYHGTENVIGRRNRREQAAHTKNLNFKRVAAYIREHYHHDSRDVKKYSASIGGKKPAKMKMMLEDSAPVNYKEKHAGVSYSMAPPWGAEDAVVLRPPKSRACKSLKKPDFDFPLEETFSEMLLRIMRERNLTSTEVYTEACIDRKLFSKIQNKKEYQPKKNTVIRFALALKLSLEETKKLLETAGYALSRSSFKDLVISFCIEQNMRTVWEVNGMLEDWKQPEI